MLHSGEDAAEDDENGQGDDHRENRNDRDQAVDWCSENGYGGPMRVVKITVSMSPPEETSAEVSVTVPDDAGEVVSATA